MAPSEHITWFEDNIRWFEDLRLEQLERAVPACRGWSVQDVINHLSHGLGLGYPVAMAASPDADSLDVFDGVDWPSEHPVGGAALSAFTENMAECARQFRETDPTTPCWTYVGVGTASFWFRRAAIETTLHRMDVAEALNIDIKHLRDDRAADAIEETFEVVLPLAAEMTRIPNGHIVVESSCLESSVASGAGDAAVVVAGEPHDLLNALWGRHRNRVTVTGGHETADEWLALIENAFAGR